LIRIELQHEETIVAKETIVATTSKDRETITAIKEIAPRTASKETLLLLETHQMPASNVEKKDITPGTVQNITQITNITELPT